MPYYIFKITSPTALVKNLDYQQAFESFKEAKLNVRQLREELPLDSGIEVKMCFAANQLAAEETLMEKRQVEVVMEWEK